MGVSVDHLVNFHCYVVFFFCLRPVPSLLIVHPWLPIRFSLMFTYNSSKLSIPQNDPIKTLDLLGVLIGLFPFTNTQKCFMPASLEENTFLTDKHILKHLKFHMHVYISDFVTTILLIWLNSNQFTVTSNMYNLCGLIYFKEGSDENAILEFNHNFFY